MAISRGMVISNVIHLLTPFSFFRLKSDDIKLYQWHFPTVLAAIIVAAIYILDPSYLKFNLSMAVSSTTNLMGVLIGFYIAALAAVTSFPNVGLDGPMKGSVPVIRERYKKVFSSISRRRFLSILLGYCAFIAILVYVMGSVASAVTLGPAIDDSVSEFLKLGWWFVYTWVLSSLLTVTLLCLHYLIDRMHRD
ncbi:hypothetical protein [Frigidibacter sp. MR17.24]|uniref:hypothetical protein n=1 Tax=Frigidibacter sp. MR17.24 TaxID=3127345 RepID=UPI003012CDA4